MTQPTSDDDVILGGAHLRSVAGIALLLLNGVLMILDAVHREAVTVPDVALHLGLLLASYLLISREKLTDLLQIVKDKLPSIPGNI